MTTVADMSKAGPVVAALAGEGLFSPDAILTAITALDGAVRQLGKELFDHSDVDGIDDFLDGWNIFVDSWVSFKDEHQSFISRVWDSTRDQLVVYGNQFNNWRQRWADLYAATNVGHFEQKPDEPTGPLSAASKALDDLALKTGVALKHVLIVVGVLAGVAGLGYVAYRVTR